jgi:hypothetical protein
MFGTGLPIGTSIALVLMIALPIITYGLYLVDRRTADGYVTVLGRR